MNQNLTHEEYNVKLTHKIRSLSKLTCGIPFCLAALALLMSSVGCEPADPVADPVDKDGASKSATNEVAGKTEAADKAVVASKPLEKTFTEKIPPTLVEFEMVLVEGEKDAKPFYIGKHEVTWDEYAYWALCKDIREKKAILEREKLLRPSAPHDSEGIYRGWGAGKQPVVGVSRLSAELYCAWLSKETGKKYRLPTAEEWERAFVAGGGKLDEPLEKSVLKESAWYVGNTLSEETFDNRAMPVGKKTPNAIGVHDMLGNVAEWVSGDEETKVVRGGSFITKAENLTGSLQEIENQDVWNKNYPQQPKSIWWYVDADYVGFRLVCEAQ